MKTYKFIAVLIISLFISTACATIESTPDLTSCVGATGALTGIFGTPCPTPGQEQQRKAVADGIRLRNEARAVAMLARNSQLATITRTSNPDGSVTETYEAREVSPELVRALADREAADTSDENTQAVYAGGNADGVARTETYDRRERYSGATGRNFRDTRRFLYGR